MKTAYIVYWDLNYNVISQPVMHAETVYPIGLIQAIKVFAPANAVGCNFSIEYADGNMSNHLIWDFRSQRGSDFDL